jgi:2-keto-4-pentenoate hydratase/2-oxohepta-3-ene-1,7-dioic acid hydratase in catechol pathway
MRVVRYARDGGVRAGLIEGDRLTEAGTDLLHPVPDGRSSLDLTEVSLLAPVVPGKIVAVGLNYADHARESDQEPPGAPVLFAKFPTSVVGPGEPATIPGITTQLDYEAELGVVIGRGARGIPAVEALGHVFGYTCVNDLSARDLQAADGQWVRGKSLDGSCPVGPWVITSEEIPDPQALRIRCVVNGEVVQDSSTAEMIFGVAELVSFISQGITLEPGDLILTGTPAGVGFVRRPPRYLQDGDVVSVEIEGIGTLTNPIGFRPPP